MRFLRGGRWVTRRLDLERMEQRQLLAADVIISEIMYHPAADDTGLEFIELYNDSDAGVDLEGWQFSTGVDFDFPAVAIPPQGYLVVAADTQVFATAYPNVTSVVGGWEGRLANRGENVTLLDAAGEIVDSVRYADEGDWAERRFLAPDDAGQRGWEWLAPHDGDGRSLELVNPQLPNEFGHNWAASSADGGSPGAANSAFSQNVAPLIVDVSHAPAIPRSTDAVTVSLKVFDERLDTVSATLFWRPDLDDHFQQVAIERTGSVGVAQIPALPHGTVVEFYVEATDSDGNRRVVPTWESDDPQRSANLLYQVDDEAVQFEDWPSDQQTVNYLVMTDVERTILRDIGDGPLLEASSNSRMNATFIQVDGNSQDVRYQVGVRNRGGSSRIGPPNNYRINFAHDATFQGRTSLNLNSRFTHAQVIGSAIYRLAGLPAAEARPVQVRVNGLDLAEPGGPLMFGSYAELEVITGSFPDRYFPDDRRGNLYRVIEAGTQTGDLRFEGNDPAAYQDTYLKRTNEESDDWSDLIELVDVLNNSSDEIFETEVSRVIDVDQWLRYVALDSLLGNLETGLNVGRGDNYWLYRGVEDSRFRIIPHDLDTILGIGRVGQPNRSIFAYTATAGLSRLLTHEAFVPRYYAAFEQLIEEVYNPETLFPLMDQLVGHVSEQELDDMKQFVVDRIAGVRAQLPTEFIITSDLPMVDGYHRTTLPSAELFGTADALRTESVMVNGQAADWSPFTRQWSVTTQGQGQSRLLVEPGSSWRYFDRGTEPAAAWKSASFADASWNVGAAPLGYGEDDLATTVSFGGNPNDKHITTYFRRKFEVADRSQVLDLSMRLERDDGAIVYLNNQEVARTNMPAGPVDFQTVASSWIGGGLEGQQLTFAIDPALLVDGANVLAVEVHQATAIDDDLKFELSLEATVGDVSGGVPLYPGINRVLVEAFDGPHGTGQRIDSGFVDIWYDGTNVSNPALCGELEAAGTLSPTVVPNRTIVEDTVFAPCGAAYRVTGQVTVAAGAKVTVLPGTTLFFEADAGLVLDGGTLDISGEEYASVRLTRAPELQGSWNGIQFNNSTSDNRISHAVLEHASTEAGLVGLQSSRLTIDNTTLDHADLFRVVTVDSSLVIRDSVFTDMFAPGEPPASDNASEHIKGSGILAGGELVLEGNYFGRTTGHNDAVDFDGAALPGPIPIIRNNYFAGSGDDALDLESDAYIEGNTFVDVVRDQYNTSTGDANAISAGDGRNYYVYRNFFYNVDHAVQVKDDAFLTFEHNTVDTVHISPIFFDLDDRSPGKGAFVNASIFFNTPVTFAAADQAEVLSVHNSIVTEDGLSFGEGNIVADPRIADAPGGDFRLLPGSPASGKGSGGRDLGAAVEPAVWISGEPTEISGRHRAQVSVGGPGLTQYRYRLLQGEWSEPIEAGVPIELRDLTDGAYHVDVVGRNAAGIWQSFDGATRSKVWNVNTGRNPVLISEVLALNHSIDILGATPDLVELHNNSDAAFDLSGMTLSDDLSEPDKFRFDDGTTIGPGAFMTLLASESNSSTQLELGFRLDRDGEGLYLHDANGDLIDFVEFGMQIADKSISRLGHDMDWGLSEPTFGEANVAAVTGTPQSLRINEWLAVSDVRFTGDFLELHNADTVPVPLGGLYLTDDPIARADRHQIAPLSYIAAGGYQVFDPGGNVDNGANELPFGISADGEILALFDSELRPIDQVLLLQQTVDRAQGRLPDESGQVYVPPLATPGDANPTINTETTDVLGFDAVWSFEQSGRDPGVAWRETEFDAGDWPRGPGPFVSSSVGGLPVDPGSTVDTGIVSHYFRSEFEVDSNWLAAGDVSFELLTLIDDGAVFYINNHELMRIGMRDGEVDYLTTASRGIGTATIEGPYTIPSSLLVEGRNVIAVELHQISPTSDVTFGASITATRTFTDPVTENAIALHDGLRITELMYNPPSDDRRDEFLELTNVSDGVLDLRGVTISGGIEVTDFAGQLEPGEHVVLVPENNRFAATYGEDIRVVGFYDGALGNGGEELVLHLPAPRDTAFDGAILRFTYDDAWYPTTDGQGYSLEVNDERGRISAWNQRAGWRPSDEVGGSPGRGQNVSVPGDVNSDGTIDVDDIDELAAAIRSMSEERRFDVNADGRVDIADHQVLTEDILQTRAGDTNIDGLVDFSDFLTLSSRFGLADASWSDGDFNADGQVGFADFLLLSGEFGFARPAAIEATLQATDAAFAVFG